jgi:hypothetical protein
MASYRIICTTKQASSHGTQHVASVGTSSGTRMTVAQARTAIDNGDTFHTEEGGSRAAVVKFDCWCGIHTLRSHEDHTTLNNLDNLKAC